ncbi:uncharacterized protein F4807DRAFT_422515, partial [Annulohypoxylon truncatum]|uniref:uncharacterized protein n=1 Tax=Annulohypoxylon truncatum TaxID=327061 RepID=UPI0020086EC3
MDEHVEARSLASLNYLAANPPQYPKKPNEERQDPIILYISRVPGTRDIILSTLKPQVKSVTAEDVASSLYYVHLNGPEDEALIPPPGQTKPPSPRTSGESSRSANQIQRKPVPGASSLASSRVDENAPPPSIKENQGNNGQTKPPMRNPSLRKPVPQSASAPLSQRPPASQFVSPPPPPPRRPVGPRPIASESPERNQPLSPIYDQPEYQMRPSMEVPSLPPRPSELEDPFVGYGRSPSPKSPSKQRPFTPFSLTLIRRDPSSGQQWNVGKVASFQLENPELIHEEKHRHPSPSIMIHLETSGYAKFRGMPTQTTSADIREIRASLDMRPGSASSSMKFPQIPDLNPPATTSNAFERQVVMAYSKSFGATIRDKFHHHRSTSDEDRSPPPVFPPRKARHGSMGSIGSFGGDFDGGEAPVITQPAPGLKPRGYMFKSPWGGRCEFVTGNAGRSLKCRHVLPNYTGTVFNPLVDGQEAGHHGHKPKGQPISELRFNLPSSELFAEKRSTEGGVRTRDQLQSQFNKVLQKAHGIDHYYDDDDDGWHLDLSLGREKAGGGNRGKRAKMGKLIVFDDGLKMLDLVVAANVGVWWTAWERTERADSERDLAHDI